MKTLSGFDVQEIGTILEIRKIIIKLKGLPTCALGQPLLFPGDARGMVVGFDQHHVDALLFEDASNLKSGDQVIARQETLRVPVGNALIGRVVNGLAKPCDGKELIKPDAFYPVFGNAPAITERAALTRQIQTGTKILDSVIPIAKGQRELIIGDRVTGKTTLAVDAILNQKDKDIVCVYCCIGRSFNFVLKLNQLLHERGAMDYSVIVSSPADAPVGEQYLAPYTAASIGEYFMRQGKDVLVVFDDLTKHAWIYRQIALLLDRSPGREAYPGDIFYIHSQLMERAAQLNTAHGGGSMSFLPIVETQQGDVTGYISTNLISMTDGQIYMSSELFQEGFKPAVDLGLSVSRIGNKIQSPAMRSLCGSLRLDYVQFKELQAITKLRSTLSREAQAKIKHGNAASEILKQSQNETVEPAEQILLFYALKKNALDDLPTPVVQEFKKSFFLYMKEHYAAETEKFIGDLTLSDEYQHTLNKALSDYLSEKGI